MIRITNVTARNFLSVGNCTQAVDLCLSPLTLILGQNTEFGAGISRNGSGKAQPLTANVKVPGGWKSMGEIVVGDVVCTPDGSTATVIGTFPQGEKDIYKLTFADGRSTECCEDHLWRVWMRKGDPWGWHTVSLHDIALHKRTKKHALSSRVYVPLIAEASGTPTELPIDPRMLGILLGDGCFTNSTPSFSTKDQELIDYVALCLPVEYRVTKVGNSVNHCDYRIARSSEPYTGDYELKRHEITHIIGKPLAELGLRGLRSHEKFVPEVYKRGSTQQRIQLLQGLLDTDGYVGPRGSISFCTTSRRLALDVQEIVRSIGGVARISDKSVTYTYGGVRKNGKQAYNVNIRYKNPRSLLGLTRKKNRVSETYQYSDTLRLELIGIEYVGKKHAKCILIDHDDHLYITDDYIVTHNTTLLQAISYALYGEPLSKITLDNLCNSYNGKGMLVTIDFERDGKRFRIERGRKPNVLHWFVDGAENDAAQGKNSQTQEEIDRVVGMSLRMFRHVVALNTFTTPFLREKASDQRESIEELLGITLLSQRAEALKRVLDITKEQLRNAEATLKANTEANARIQQAIDRSEVDAEAWQRLHTQRVAELQSKAEAIIKIDIDAEIAVFDRIDDWQRQRRDIDEQIATVKRQQTVVGQEIARRREDLQRYQGEASSEHGRRSAVVRLERQEELYRAEAVDVLPPSQLERLHTEAARHRDSATAKQTEAEALVADLDGVRQHLFDPSSHTCPTCSQSLVGTDHAKVVIEELTAQEAMLLARIERLLTESARCLADAEAVEHEIDQRQQAHADHQRLNLERAEMVRKEIVAVLAEQETLRNAALANVAEVQAAIEDLMETESEFHRTLPVLRLRLEELGSQPTSRYPDRNTVWQLRQQRDALLQQLEMEIDKVNPHHAKLDTLRGTLATIDYTSVNELSLKLKHETFLHKLLTAKDSFIRKRIVDQNLSYLNSRLDHYLGKLGLPHEVRFLPDLSVEITLLGRQFDFEQLSRGEMARVTLATCWGFRDVWENLNTRFNLLFLDEMLDAGIDEAGAEAAWSSLQDMARGGRNIFVISHRESLEGRADQVLLVRKEAQFTTFSLT